ncbi:hypothetical protein JV34_22220 [Pectobacterium atrosepticum]|nr:hypothetical protein JV34_22220 [Pectobacterium atrosepticum]
MKSAVDGGSWLARVGRWPSRHPVNHAPVVASATRSAQPDDFVEPMWAMRRLKVSWALQGEGRRGAVYERVTSFAGLPAG